MSSRIRDASMETLPASEQCRRGASTAARGVRYCRRSRTWKIAGVMRSLPGEPMASHGLRPRKTIVGATLAQGTALGRR